ncbi:MAG: hypothetical protein JXQ83_02960 [Candidatus Glassbacteria bacterium]|nr:hypothetical protein [Candidatus Glassbacteria bacterium]
MDASPGRPEKISRPAANGSLAGGSGNALLRLLFLALFWTACAQETPSYRDLTVRVAAPETTGHPAAGTGFLLIDDDPNLILCRVRLDNLGRGSQIQMSEFRLEIEDCSIEVSSADEHGRLSFHFVPPGSYWVVNLDPVRLGEDRVIWAHPVRVPGDEAAPEVRLQRSNAALFVVD